MTDELIEKSDATVTMSVKEWLARIDVKVDTITANKADKADLIAFMTEVERLKDRVAILERESIREESKKEINTSNSSDNKTNMAIIISVFSVTALAIDAAVQTFRAIHGS